MPIFMDIHEVPGVKALDVAEAHRLDLQHQQDFKCKCMTYWVDEARETIFCLIEGPNKDSVAALHGKAHGLLPSKIIEVNPELVTSFLGRIYDPEDAEITPDGLKIINDPSFRILMVTAIDDACMLENKVGKERSRELLQHHKNIIRKNIARFEGHEVEHEGNGFIVSF